MTESQQYLKTVNDVINNKHLIKSPSLSSINDSRIHTNLDESSYLNHIVKELNNGAIEFQDNIVNKSLNINLESQNNNSVILMNESMKNDDKHNNFQNDFNKLENNENDEVSNKLNVCIEISDMRDLTHTRTESDKNDDDYDHDVANIS